MNKRTSEQIFLHHCIMECGAKYNIPLMWRKGDEEIVFGIPRQSWETVGYSKPERNAPELVNKRTLNDLYLNHEAIKRTQGRFIPMWLKCFWILKSNDTLVMTNVWFDGEFYCAGDYRTSK